VWIKLSEREDGSSVVEVGGLDRADARAGLTDDVAELAHQLSRAEPGLPAGSKGSGAT
jgi:cytochrome c biogenesis protein